MFSVFRFILIYICLGMLAFEKYFSNSKYTKNINVCNRNANVSNRKNTFTVEEDGRVKESVLFYFY